MNPAAWALEKRLVTALLLPFWRADIPLGRLDAMEAASRFRDTQLHAKINVSVSTKRY